MKIRSKKKNIAGRQKKKQNEKTKWKNEHIPFFFLRRMRAQTTQTKLAN